MHAVLFILLISVLQGGQSSVCNTYLQVVHNAKGQVGPYKYGDTINFSCELHNQTVTEIPNLFLWNIENQTKTPISNIESKIGYTDVKVVSKESGGTYSCRYGNCSEDTLLSALLIKLDECSFPRKEDSRRPNLTCIVNDLDNMTCDWAVRGNSKCTIWTAKFKTEVQDMYKSCTADESRNCTSTDVYCQITDDDFYRFIQYNISLTGISEQSIKTYYYTKVPDDSIVQIYLDNAVRVRQGKDPYTLVIGFTLHHPPDAVSGMLCSVSYTSEWDRNDTVTSAHNLTQSELDVTITLDKLTPFTNYTVGITCKPLASPYWSNCISGFGRTRPAVCDSVPGIIGYYDMRTDITGQRKIYLYFKPLKRRQWYGLRTKYLVSVDVEDTSYTEVFSADSITGELNETFATNQSYTVFVRTENEAGVTNLSVGINISSTDMQDMHLLTVVAEETSERSHVSLFPEHTNGDSSVTYYFCLGEQNTYPPICKSEIRSETTSTFLLPEKPKHMKNYIWYYGVSEYRSNTLSSNRIQWSNCVFRKNGGRMTSTKQLEVYASLLPSNKSVVLLSLNFEYCQLKHRPISYYVGFWETDRNVSNYCKNKSAELKNFTAAPSVQVLQVYIGRLAEVTLCMKVQYNGQSDVIENIVPVFLSTGNSVVSPGVKNTGNGRIISIAVVCSLIFSMLLAILVHFSRKRIKELVNRNKIPDEIIAKILQESPDDRPTQNCLWLNSDESSGVYTIDKRSTEDQPEVKSMRNSHSSSNGFKDSSRLESDTLVHSTGDNTNTVGDYLEPHINSRNTLSDQAGHTVDDYLKPHINSRNTFSDQAGSSCTDYQLVSCQRNIEERRMSSGDGYLVATSRLRDEPFGDTVRDNARNMTNEVENQLNFVSVSADTPEDLRRQVGEDSGNLSPSGYQQAVALSAVSVNSSNLSSYGYLLADTHAVPNNHSIPSCWQSFDMERHDSIRNLRVSGHAAAFEVQENSSFGQESLSCDEYMRVYGNELL